MYATGFRKSGFHTHSMTARHTFHHHMIAVHTNISGRYQCWKLPRLLLLWLPSTCCQMSMNAQVILEWFHLPMDKQTASYISNHTTGWWGWACIQLFCVLCKAENTTNWCYLAVFTLHGRLACHSMALYQPPPSTPIGVLVVLA